MNIGTVTINSKIALAPMAGVSDQAFRVICRELGCGYTVTEMISAKALCYQDKRPAASWHWLWRASGRHSAVRAAMWCAWRRQRPRSWAGTAGHHRHQHGLSVPKVANSGDTAVR